jgi:hypothetical protein
MLSVVALELGIPFYWYDGEEKCDPKNSLWWLDKNEIKISAFIYNFDIKPRLEQLKAAIKEIKAALK